MPYDPNFPPQNADLISAEFRAQFHGLKDLIDAVPGITAVQVDGVSTVAPGQPAGVSLSITGHTLHFTFAIPRGVPGGNGADGAQGPPFASAIVDGVSTLNPGDAATVGVSFDGTSVHFTFGLPRGADGTNGTNGSDGAPGEVSNATLAAAIAETSANTNAVGTLDMPFANDPPTPADMESLRAKINELILAARR